MLYFPSGKNLYLNLLLPYFWFTPILKIKPGYFVTSSPEMDNYREYPKSDFDALIEKNQHPLPRSIEDIKEFITIKITDYYDQGVCEPTPWINFYPEKYLSPDEVQIWEKWKISEPVKIFLQISIDRCFQQVEENQDSIREDAFLVDNVVQFLNKTEIKKKKNSYFSDQCNRDYLNQLLAIIPGDEFQDPLWISLIDQYLNRVKVWDEGERFFLNLYKKYPERKQYHAAYFNCLISQKRFREIEEVLWDLVVEFPHETLYWEILVKVYVYQNLFHEALHITDLGFIKNPSAKVLKGWVFLINKYIRVIEKIHRDRWQKKICPSLRKHFKNPPDNRYHPLHLFFKHHRRKKE